MSNKSIYTSTILQSIFGESPDIFSLIINHEGTIVSANKTFTERLNLKLLEKPSKNFINDFNDILNSVEIEKTKIVIKTLKPNSFDILIKNKNYRFILTPHLNSEKIVKCISIIGFPLLSDEETVVELKSTINSQNKQNSDLLELIEKLSLQNIDLAKTNDSLTEKLTNRDKFFSILSHDLRGQMGNMINGSDLLVESFDNLDINDQKNIVGMLNKSIRKNYNLLDNLLLWASFERGRISLNIEKVKLSRVVNDSLESLKNEISKKNIVIKNRINNDITANCDFKYMKLVIINILSNSIKFSFSGGTIEIYYNNENEKVIEIIITDQGIGMNNTKLNDLFKIDKIHSNYGTEKESGSGIGLLVAKKIIDELNGELNITTELNKGTSVQILIKNDNLIAI